MKHCLNWLKRCVWGGGVLGMLAGSAVVHAQAANPSAEIDLDMRTHIAAVGPSGSQLQATTLRLAADLAPGLHVMFYGTHAEGFTAVQQASVEKEWGGTAGRAQAGLVRLPFGIHDTRETYASGLIDYPLARGDYFYHSLDWGAPGVAWTGGPARLQVEAAGFDGLGTGIWNNQAHIRGGAVRAQTYAGNAIVGLSHWDGALQDDPGASQLRPVHMTGLDLRYTRTQLLVRGEYLRGTLAGSVMRGWYLDAYYRLPQQVRWSVVGRLERYKPDKDASEVHQWTLGVRYIAAKDWTLAANWRQNQGISYAPIWTAPTAKAGDIYLQAYHHTNW